MENVYEQVNVSQIFFMVEFNEHVDDDDDDVGEKRKLKETFCGSMNILNRIL